MFVLGLSGTRNRLMSYIGLVWVGLWWFTAKDTIHINIKLQQYKQFMRINKKHQPLLNALDSCITHTERAYTRVTFRIISDSGNLL